ncbi:hypothetical protein B9Z45_15575 [Limnohabitans sp. 2KL-17]|uniref:hypothetical protein n=1 Tax=Limnohabitans sp. 2KL-17 TaxID=1100704 RepID=UPI000D33D644|nr:hypothetical protein [Limnohabitans sp. 2KL-17]PUE49837.1 hypothetical protein B9Z45_15575 [Limnohabitans sp. 2KL-17]
MNVSDIAGAAGGAAGMAAGGPLGAMLGQAVGEAAGQVAQQMGGAVQQSMESGDPGAVLSSAAQALTNGVKL